jgi:hypothetical protein
MYYLGIDVSTTATKALLIDAAGVVISVSVQNILRHRICGANNRRGGGRTQNRYAACCSNRRWMPLKLGRLD